MGWDAFAYWICFLSGIAYASVAALLGGLFGFGHGGAGAGGMEPAAHDFGTSHDVGAGHGEATAGVGPEEVAISPLSPMTLATFSTVFGGTGLILTRMFHYNLYVSLPSAVAAGLLVAGAVFSIFYRLFNAVQGTSEVTMANLVGLTGEVTVAIPAAGVGGVAYIALGNRQTALARSQEGEDIPLHTPVRVVRVVGSTIYVTVLDKPERSGEASAS